MVECPETSNARALLVYCIVCTGIVLTWSVLLVLLWTVRNKVDKARYTDESVILPCSIAICLSLERAFRFPEHYTRFNGPRTSSDTLYYFANTFLTISLALLFNLQTMRLRRCFTDSKYEVPSETISNIYVVSAVSVVSLLSWTITNGFPKVYKNDIGQISLNILALVSVGSALLALLWINYAFVSRLKMVVTEHMINCGTKTPRSPQTPIPGHSGQSGKKSPMKRTITTMFKGSDRKMLKLASRSTVLSLWITGCLICLLISAAFFSFGDCADGLTIIANLTALLAIPTISLCTYLGLKECSNHYKVVCQLCDRHIGQLTANDTDRRVAEAYGNDEEDGYDTEITEINTQKNTSMNHQNGGGSEENGGGQSGAEAVDSVAQSRIIAVQHSADEITVTEALTAPSSDHSS